MKQPQLLVLQATSDTCYHMAVEMSKARWASPITPSSISHTLVSTCHLLQPRQTISQSVSTKTSQRDGSCFQITLCSSCHCYQDLLSYSYCPQWAVNAFFMLYSYIQAFSVAIAVSIPPGCPFFFFFPDQGKGGNFKAAIKQENKAAESSYQGG